MSFSDDTIASFDKEVAKYPAEQKASAVMACLAIVRITGVLPIARTMSRYCPPPSGKRMV